MKDQLQQFAPCGTCGMPLPMPNGEWHWVNGKTCIEHLQGRLRVAQDSAAAMEQARDRFRRALIEIRDYTDPNVKPPNVNVAVAVYNTAKQVL